jgi:hypothetical protein
MDEDKQKGLLDLRDEVINELTPLIEEAVVDPQQKFTILLAAAGNKGSTETLESAHKAALQIEDQRAKVDALLELLDEVDFQLQPKTSNQPEPEPTTEESNEPELQTDQGDTVQVQDS